MPAVAMVGVNEEMGKTCVEYRFPPDSPNLRMLDVAAIDPATAFGPEPFAALIARELPQWRDLVREAGITAD